LKGVLDESGASILANRFQNARVAIRNLKFGWDSIRVRRS
jgi:hypothetical protein